jgi:hypothetical protein
VYEGAIYMHQGVNYLVVELDLSSKTAFCWKADVNYYTKTQDYTEINVLGGDFVCFWKHYNTSHIFLKVLCYYQVASPPILLRNIVYISSILIF